MKKIIFVLLGFLVISTIKSQNNELQGTWKLDNVSILKIINNDTVWVDPGKVDENMLWELGVFKQIRLDNNYMLFGNEEKQEVYRCEPEISETNIKVIHARNLSYQFKIEGHVLSLREEFYMFLEDSYYNFLVSQNFYKK